MEEYEFVEMFRKLADRMMKTRDAGLMVTYSETLKNLATAYVIESRERLARSGQKTDR